MPITRRRRANPPDQPENNNNHAADQPETTHAEALPTERPAETPAPGDAELASSVPPAAPAPARTEGVPYQPALPTSLATNGDRADQRDQRNERPEYTPSIEAGRRTARGELFRRPPQVPVPPTPPVPAIAAATPLQAPTHEINLPLGNLLHLAYNPSYTGSDEARSTLLHKLAHDSKAGGRGRCWSCGSLAIAYDYWNTRSKNFGEVGVAFCEICGVWSVM